MSTTDVIVVTGHIYIIILMSIFVFWSYNRFPFANKFLGKNPSEVHSIIVIFFRYAGPIGIAYQIYLITKLVFGY